MSKHKNVHPGHYKTDGSLYPGEEVVQSEHKEKLTRKRAELERRQGNEHREEEREQEQEQDENARE